MHHPQLNHKVHTWPKSDEFCREFGDNTRMVEVHTEEQKEYLSQLVGGLNILRVFRNKRYATAVAGHEQSVTYLLNELMTL